MSNEAIKERQKQLDDLASSLDTYKGKLLTPVEKADVVLLTVKKLEITNNGSDFTGISTSIFPAGYKNKTFENLNIIDIEKILNILIQKGYVENNLGVYKVSFDGDFLIQDGGYSKLTKKERANLSSQKLRDRLLLLFSFLAGIGAFGIWVWEVRKFYPYFLEIWKY